MLTILALFFIFSSAESFAVQSATKVTKIGDAPTTSDIAKAAIDVKDAFDVCSDGSTYNNRVKPGVGTLSDCLAQFLYTRNYTDQQVAAFIKRRTGFPSEGVTGTITGLGCTECLGFVAISLSLALENPYTLSSGTPKSIKDNFTSFIVGDPSRRPDTHTFRAVDRSGILPGDVAMGHGCESIGTAGHALIVTRVTGNRGFVAAETSFPTTCYTNKSQQHVTDCYVFYRKQ